MRARIDGEPPGFRRAARARARRRRAVPARRRRATCRRWPTRLSPRDAEPAGGAAGAERATARRRRSAAAPPAATPAAARGRAAGAFAPGAPMPDARARRALHPPAPPASPERLRAGRLGSSTSRRAPSSEARGRRPAVRRRHQRRRRAARALRRRASGAARPTEVLTTCARDYVTWRNELPAARRPSTAFLCTAFRSLASAMSTTSPADPPASSSRRIRSPTSWPGSTRRSGESRPHPPSACRARGLRLLHLLQLSLLPRVSRCPGGRPVARCSCRPPSATRPSASRCSGRCSAACARSCTTPPKSRR